MPINETLRRLANARHTALIRKDQKIARIKEELQKTLPLFESYFKYDTQDDVNEIYCIIERILKEN